jgi:hypothetical protein
VVKADRKTKTNAFCYSTSHNLNTRPLQTTPNTFELLNIAIVFDHDSPDPPQNDDDITVAPPTKKNNKQHRKAHIRRTLRELALADSLFLDNSITQAEDERTASLQKMTPTTRFALPLIQHTNNKYTNQA